MPMQARFEDGANYRWLNKPVAESRLLVSMENLSNWRFGGAGEVSLTEARAKDGSRSLRMRSMPRTSGGSDWDGLSVTRTFPGEDWRPYNRISIWVYPDITGAPAISFSMTLHNDGAHKLPD